MLLNKNKWFKLPSHFQNTTVKKHFGFCISYLYDSITKIMGLQSLSYSVLCCNKMYCICKGQLLNCSPS